MAKIRAKSAAKAKKPAQPQWETTSGEEVRRFLIMDCTPLKNGYILDSLQEEKSESTNDLTQFRSLDEIRRGYTLPNEPPLDTVLCKRPFQ